MADDPSRDKNIWISDNSETNPHVVMNLDIAIDAGVTVAMSLKGTENEERRREVIRGLSGLADTERMVGVDKHPEERFRYVAQLADSNYPGNVAATEVIEALHP